MKRISKAFRVLRGEENGFTLVELTMVMIISTIMLAGLVMLVFGAMQQFNSSKDLQSVNDSSRRIMQTMARQIRTTLHISDSDMVTQGASGYYVFWADVDDDQGSAADVDNYDGVTEKVWFYRAAANKMMVFVNEIGVPDVTGSLGSYVTGLTFYYFQPGVVPTGNPYAPTNGYTGTNWNEEIGMVRIVLRLTKNKVRRTFYQDVFLRVLNRKED